MNHTAKDWRSIDEKIEIIRSRGMVIEDDDEAAHFLRRVGYYRLSGYWYPFRQFNDGKRANEFFEGSKFDDVVALYLFDRKLRLMAMDAIERIELAIQVEIAHLLGRRDTFAQQFQHIIKLVNAVFGQKLITVAIKLVCGGSSGRLEFVWRRFSSSTFNTQNSTSRPDTNSMPWPCNRSSAERKIWRVEKVAGEPSL